MNCPASRIRPPYSYTFNFPPFPSFTWQASASDYTPLVGVAPSLYSVYVDPAVNTSGDPRLQGALQPDINMPIINISDGTSNTILLAEVAGKNELWQAGKDAGMPLSGFFGGEGGWGDATSAASQLYGSTADGTINPGVCGINCSNDFGLYSFHTGGANVLMADGSVQFKVSGIGIAVLSELVTARGGEFASQY
jgi:prepilin-type processing-associated H-X9-DG protein